MAKKVLIIDDDPTVIRLNEKLLSEKDYEVITAMDGADGLKKALNESPDVIILDIILPGMHGFDVCKSLKDSSQTKDIPIIMVTATGLEDVAKNEPDVKADGYLAKPYGVKELEEVISQVL